METFLYAIIFITGIFFGSFFTLAVHRIPKKEDILIKHSYCPNCNHKLGFFDLFPVLSYIILGGKCRYCKGKIIPRYLILELLSGLTFLILAVGTKIDINNISSVIYLIFLFVYVSILFIIAGIDKEHIKIQKNVLLVGVVIEVLYIIYQYTLTNFSVYQYVICLIASIVILIVLNICFKEEKNKEYLKQILYLSLYMIIGTGFSIYLGSIVLCFITSLVHKKILNQKEIPVGFYLSISNVLIVAISNIIINYI